MSLYNFSTTAPVTTTTSTSSAPVPTATSGLTPSGWTSVGCVTDSSSSRTLPYEYGDQSTMTTAICQSGCQSLGYLYAGTEYSSQVS